MNYPDVLNLLSPCGLDCGRCADHKSGEIKHHAAKLRELLNNYGRLAKIKSAVQPAFHNYPDFEKLLDYFSAARCGGCRGPECHCPIECTVKTCHKEQHVDFCFQCSHFPCDKKLFSEALQERWLRNNNRMKEIGVVDYYIEQSKQPRY